MKEFKRILALLLCAAMVFGLFGCSQNADPTEPPVTATEAPATEPPATEPDAMELYSSATQAIRDAKNLTLKLTTEKTIQVGLETYDAVSTQRLVLTGIGTDGLKASLTEDLSVRDIEDTFQEYYADGTLYLTIADEYKYQGEQTTEEFMARFAPAVLLDASLYENVTAAYISTGAAELTFEAPSGAESWALPEGAQFHTAKGSAAISSDGVLTKSTYTIEYVLGSMTVTQTITAEPVISDEAPAAPEDPAAYIQVSSIDAPRLYDMAVIWLCAARTISSNMVETVVSQAAAYTYTSQYNTHYYGSSKSHCADITYSVSDYQNGGASSSYTQTEHFEDYTYTISIDGGEPQKEAGVALGDVMDYAWQLFCENIPSMDYMTGMEAENVGGLVYLDISMNDDYGTEMNYYINSNLFSDEAFLDNMASAYRTDSCSHYMIVDPVTGFPTAVGITYSGTHTIDGYEYMQSLQVDQNFLLSGESTYEAITGELLPEEEPETPATPLFYKVTGPNGETMWLLGTIHVGDERTAYLPTEIYDALNASDALAVEFDTLAFEEAMESDEKLVSQIATLYFNANNAETKSLLDEDVYETAVKLLKAGGNYSMNAEYMKPYLWSQSIDNFYLALDQSLSSSKGVDTRLLKLAKEAGKEILDVESGLFQLQMMTGFSTDLQVMILEESLGYSAGEYNADVHELLDAWCLGDEAALRELLNSEEGELTEEEQKLYEEYNNAMIIKRNEGMLKVAIDYLNSGKTVFYAVGLAHLLQDNGLVDTLRDAGYTVELVAYN